MYAGLYYFVTAVRLSQNSNIDLKHSLDLTIKLEIWETA